jgi:hypothetical protein
MCKQYGRLYVKIQPTDQQINRLTDQHEIAPSDIDVKIPSYSPPNVSRLELGNIAGGTAQLQEADGFGWTS